ncbi:family 10 glycosylhydrolase [Sphingobacterium sp. SGG-5]|uniref:glycoside hydrolase family 10 protein n=1 Tax=Sphingobacterium sp. SGG-5 TaxID=2710881 RepID=UPI0013E9D876|nr:family 10 glycosylhydrolase [Sphingobacterium sp. SGG-5]NGM62426.1 family 10 glycosylhydrolase [Sphingobacterium sp. SGG-5]
MKRFINYLIILCWASVLLIGCKDDPILDPTDPGEDEETGLMLPQKEMRGVWIATVYALDWPRTADFSSPAYDAAVQKASYTTMLDNLKAVGFNTVFVQVRGMADAFYDSPYEPWSASITGTRGQDPGYDVLQFMIDEAHARDLEFHAWINPYRIATRAAATTPYPALPSTIDPEWVVDHEKIQIYNPALPEVRQRLADIVEDLITKYDVDGLHMDDYFYPDPTSSGTLQSDDEEFEQYKGSFTSKGDWRRDNVSKAIELIHNTIVETKPEVVFSISPAASFTYNYNTLYADVGRWTKEGWVDILIPQLYQEIGNASNDFQFNLAYWAQYAYSAKLVIGHALYKFGVSDNPAAFQSTQELVRQFNLTKQNKKAVGSVMYSARDVYYNRIGITDKLEELYSHEAIIPFAGRKIAAEPPVPGNVKITGNELSWTASGSGIRSAVYYFEDLEQEGMLLDVVTTTSLMVSEPGYYVVTTLNEDHLESAPADPVEKK